MHRPALDAVISRHAASLLAMEGVSGVWEGRDEDDSPCVVVAVAANDTALGAKLPSTIEGYPVRLQVTGDIVPHGDQ